MTFGMVTRRFSPLHTRFVVNHDAPLKRGRLLFPDQRFRRYEMRPGWERRKQLAGFAGHVHRDRPIRFGKGTVVEQKGAIYEMNCLLKVVERPGEPAIDLTIGNIVPAGGYPLGDSRPGCFHVVQSDKNQQDGIPFCDVRNLRRSGTIIEQHEPETR